jgi:hypothetical protein
MQTPTALSLFHLMFDEARRSQPPSRERLCLLLGLSVESLESALVSLERVGLVDASRARLTMHGLTIAAATRPVSERAAGRRAHRLAA